MSQTWRLWGRGEPMVKGITVLQLRYLSACQKPASSKVPCFPPPVPRYLLIVFIDSLVAFICCLRASPCPLSIFSEQPSTRYEVRNKFVHEFFQIRDGEWYTMYLTKPSSI